MLGACLSHAVFVYWGKIIMTLKQQYYLTEKVFDIIIQVGLHIRIMQCELIEI